MTASPRGVSRHDVVVLGSGAAGLTAALAAAASGAEVGLYEKSDLLGGTTAISGGIVWVPGNHLMDRSDGINGIDGIDAAERDADPAEALRYLRALAGDALDVPVAEALVSAGPEMLRFTESASPCRFRLLAGYPDYHPGAAAAVRWSPTCLIFRCSASGLGSFASGTAVHGRFCCRRPASVGRRCRRRPRSSPSGGSGASAAWARRWWGLCWRAACTPV